MNFSPDTALVLCALWLFAPLSVFALLALARSRGRRAAKFQVRGARVVNLPPPPAAQPLNYDPDSPSGRIAEHSGDVRWLTDQDAS